MRFCLAGCLSLFLVVLTSTASLRAAGQPSAHPRLLAPDAFLTRDHAVSLTLLVPNHPAPSLPPDRLSLVWSSGDRREQNQAVRAGEAQPAVLDGVEYSAYTYTVTPPSDLLGPTLIEPDDAGLLGARVLVSIQTPHAAASLAQALDRPPSVTTATPASALAPAPETRDERVRRAVRHPLVPGISAYEPVYLVFGYREGADARFQLSFKYQPFETEWAHPLGITFSTTSLWDLHTTSVPFRDTSYRPGLSWFHDPVRIAADGHTRFQWQLGLWEHESNGRGTTHLFTHGNSTDSRSFNIGFFRPTFTYEWQNHSTLSVGLKLLTYYDRASENADIARYRGYGDFELRYRNRDFLVSGRYRGGSRGHFAEVDFGVPFGAPFKWLGFDIDPSDVHGWLLFQYLSGYGETLLDYNRRIPEQVRVGFMAVP